MTSTTRVKGAVEDLDPEIVGIVHPRQAEGKARVILEALLVHPVYVEGGIGHDEIELAASDGAVMQVS